MAERIELGKVSGVHGVKGEIKVYLYGDEEEARGFAEFAGENWKEIYLGDRPYAVSGVRAHKGVLLITLDGVSTRNAAEALRGKTVSVGKEDLPPLESDEYYEFELVGAKVEGPAGEDLGKISGVIDSGGAYVLEVRGSSRGTALIPATAEIMKLFDRGAKKLVVNDFEPYFD